MRFFVKNKQKSLMFKLMIWINVVSVLTIVALSGTIMFNIMKSTEVTIMKEMETLANSVKLTSADYVWNLNNEVLKTISSQLLDDPSIEAVKFTDAKNKVITEAQDKTHGSTAASTKNIKLPIIYGADKQVIGYIELHYNLNKVQIVKNEFYKMTFFGIICAQLFMYLVLYFVLKKTTNKLGNISEKLRGVSHKNQESSVGVRLISEEVSGSTQSQASSIQETVSTLDEITSMVNTSVDSARNSSQKAEESHRIANEGKEVVKEMIFSMEEINKSNKDIMDEIQRSNERIADIVKVINEISQKTSVINDIVFQTKLLSFNASVEAARAGEHGKGFAVVAEEVGNLARMSGTASNEISQMLSESINKVNSIISDTNKNIQGLISVGNSKVSSGVKVADRCGKVLDEVVENATIVKTMMNEVSLACKEQAEGVKNISIAMNQLDQTTLNNADTANRSFESSKALAHQADELQDNVLELEREIFGSKGYVLKEVPKAKAEYKDKVIKLKPDASTPKQEDNVLEIKRKPAAKVAAVNSPKKSLEMDTPKKASGTLEVPLASDSRFEDI